MITEMYKIDGDRDNCSVQSYVSTPANYRILCSAEDLFLAINDPRYWRIVETQDGDVEMLRVPFQVKNAMLRDVINRTDLRIATRNELAAAFTTALGHHYKYPWGDQISAKNAPVLMLDNPDGMGMNIAGLYFNGPDNSTDPRKNGLWMVTAECDAQGNYTKGYRCGAAGNVGVFPPFNSPVEKQPLFNDIGMRVEPEQRGLLPENRGVLPECRGDIAGYDGRGDKPNYLTPAGIGFDGQELYGNEGYLLVRPVSDDKREIYDCIKRILGNKVSADAGIPLVSIGRIPVVGDFLPIILFGVVGHCLSCPNIASITTPLNGQAIATAIGIPVAEFPEFANHRVIDSQPIVPEGVDMSKAGKRVFLPA